MSFGPGLGFTLVEVKPGSTPPPATFRILTEAGDVIVTEAAEPIRKEP